MTLDGEFFTRKGDKELLPRLQGLLFEHQINNRESYFRDGGVYNIRAYLEEPGIHSKLGIINRFHRTLWDGLKIYFNRFQTRKWIDVIGKLIEIYNNHPNRTTKKSPKEMTAFDIANLNQRLRIKGTQAREEFSNFKVGDRVRHIIDPPVRGLLHKKESKMTRFSSDVFTIEDINGFSFSVVDEFGNRAPRTYRYYELLKV